MKKKKEKRKVEEKEKMKPEKKTWKKNKKKRKKERKVKLKKKTICVTWVLKEISLGQQGTTMYKKESIKKRMHGGGMSPKERKQTNHVVPFGFSIKKGKGV